MSGFLKRFCGTVQWTVFAAATAAMFTVSVVGAVMINVVVAKISPAPFLMPSLSGRAPLLQVPFTYIEYDSTGRLWPGVRQAHELVDRYLLVNPYGLFRRMTGVSGRPEVVIEGSYDAVSWTVSGAAVCHDGAARFIH